MGMDMRLKTRDSLKIRDRIQLRNNIELQIYVGTNIIEWDSIIIEEVTRLKGWNNWQLILYEKETTILYNQLQRMINTTVKNGDKTKS